MGSGLLIYGSGGPGEWWEVGGGSGGGRNRLVWVGGSVFQRAFRFRQAAEQRMTRERQMTTLVLKPCAST